MTNINFNKSSSTVSFNTPSSGFMQRSHPSSTFIRFQKGSEMEGTVFSPDGSKSVIRRYGNNIEITVLQIIVFGDNHYLVEIVEDRYLV